MTDTSTRATHRRRALRLVLAGTAALMVTACSTMPDWTRPSSIGDAIGGKAPGETSNETVAAGQAAAERQSAQGSFPDVGVTPQSPASRSAQARQELADSLVADRQHARYSGEALRGGTEPPASPLPSRRAEPLPELPAAAATDRSADASPAPQGQPEAAVIPAPEIPEFRAPSRRLGDAPGSAPAAETPAAETAAASPAPMATPTARVESAPLPAPEPAPRAAAAAPSAAAPAPVAAAPAPVASAPARRPAVPSRAVPTFVAEADAARELNGNAPPARQAAAPRAAAAPVVSGEPQFAASSAPPLPDTVRDLVPAVVSARYDETGGDRTPAPQAAPSAAVPAGDGVVIDYSAIGAGSPVPDAPMEQGSAEFAPASAEGGPFAPVAVYFGHGSARLAAEDGAGLAEIAALQSARGGGTVRIVGHASSRTGNLPVDRHLMANFEMSLERANAVAAELMRLGVAPGDLMIEAVGDRAPVFYESMPAGEAGNRRAEIFLE